MLDKAKQINWLNSMVDIHDPLADMYGEVVAFKRVIREIESGTFDAPLTEESQEQHSSLADSRMMTITKFAWDEKVEQVRQLREERNAFEQGEEKLKSVIQARLSMHEKEIYDMRKERNKLVKALEAIDEYDVRDRHGHVDEWTEAASFTECQNIAHTVLSEIKGQGENVHD